ncbi:MAG: hypothetical protein JJ902_11820 [Roseibium sp.]|nr:hypothetical protein [Roseibium sp.]
MLALGTPLPPVQAGRTAAPHDRYPFKQRGDAGDGTTLGQDKVLFDALAKAIPKKLLFFIILFGVNEAERDLNDGLRSGSTARS